MRRDVSAAHRDDWAFDRQGVLNLAADEAVVALGIGREADDDVRCRLDPALDVGGEVLVGAEVAFIPPDAMARAEPLLKLADVGFAVAAGIADENVLFGSSIHANYDGMKGGFALEINLTPDPSPMGWRGESLGVQAPPGVQTPG